MLQNIPRAVSITSLVQEIIRFKGDDWLEADWLWQARISVPLEFYDVEGNLFSLWRDL